MSRILLGAAGALFLGAAVFSAVVLLGCGGGAAGPTAPPTPAPTPVPVPSATPDPNVPPAGNACGKPYPPPITRLNVKTHLKDSRDYWTIDSTPLVGPDGEYCYAVGFTDGRTICPLRPEGAQDRAACEEWRAGIAKDGKPGPTWTHIEYGTGKETLCSSAPDAPCDRHPNGPYTVKAFRGGIYRVCTEAGACAQTDVDRNL